MNREDWLNDNQVYDNKNLSININVKSAYVSDCGNLCDNLKNTSYLDKRIETISTTGNSALDQVLDDYEDYKKNYCK